MTSSQRAIHWNETSYTTYRSVTGGSAHTSPREAADPSQIGPTDNTHPNTGVLSIQEHQEAVIHQSDETEVDPHKQEKAVEVSVSPLNNHDGLESKDAPEIEVSDRPQNEDEEIQSAHRGSVPKRDGIDLVTPGYMIGSFLIGLFFSLGHHFYHYSLVGRTIGDNWQQLWVRG
jgi:hypothetical protein